MIEKTVFNQFNFNQIKSRVFLSEKYNRKPSGITPPKKLLSIFFFISTKIVFSSKRNYELSTTNISKSASN